MATHSSILAWRIPEEWNPAGLSSCAGGLRPLDELCVEPAGLCPLEEADSQSITTSRLLGLWLRGPLRDGYKVPS